MWSTPVFIPASTLEETESVLLNFREMLETQGYAQAKDAEERRQREGTHFKMCVINKRNLVSSIYTTLVTTSLSKPYRSINLNQLVIQRPQG